MHHRLTKLFLATFTISLSIGCSPDLGECDEMAAMELVYTADGTPALAGQALVNQSCGGGGFCHSAGAEPLERVGAPAGLDFDLALASSSEEFNEAAVMRLDRDQVRAFDLRHEILEQVQRGLMPPPGPEAADALASMPTYDRVAADGTSFVPLPALDTEEGEQILRNWLACGLPIVERTQDPVTIPSEYRDRDTYPLGLTVPSCARRCVDPTWPDIVEQILIPSCALSRCHDSEEPAAELDLSVADPSDPTQLEALHATLLASTAEGTLCAASEVADAPMFVPGDPDGSLLIQKVTPDLVACGSLMPLSGAQLSEQRLCALREWVMCGACADPTDPTCADCQDAARATCGVMLGMDDEPLCVDQVACNANALSGMM